MIERAIIEAAARLRRAGQPYLLATAVCQRGSAYRRAGARLILAEDCRVAGAISGGCLEGDLARRGWWRTRGRDAVVVTYDSRHDDDADDDEVRAAFAVGCNGVIDVMLERSDARAGRIDPLAFGARCLQTQRRGAIATIYRTSGDASEVGARLAMLDGDDEVVDADATFLADADLRERIVADLAAAIASGTSRDVVYDAPEGALSVFVEAMVPPPRLFVFGTGPDAVPVVELARGLGWDVVACAPRMRPVVRDRFGSADELITGSAAELAARVDAADRAVAVVMAHDYELDRAHLGVLLGSHAIYVGVLGPRARTTRMLADLGRDGAADDARLHAPIGLELGAETPQEIALAITGEIQAVIAGVPHRSLRDRQGPIHERPALHAVADDDRRERGERIERVERVACAVGA